jgi:hypothetical protein
MATNYIRDLGQVIEDRLYALEEHWRAGEHERCAAERTAFVKFVKERVLESYRNGLNAASLRVDTAAKKLERSVRA